MLPIRNADITNYRFTGFGIDDLPFFCNAARIRSAKRAGQDFYLSFFHSCPSSVYLLS